MSELFRRMTLTLLAVAVFAIGTNCACSGAPTPVKPQAELMPCCAHGHMAHCPHNAPPSQDPCDKSCQHCTQLVVNDSVPAADLTPSHFELWTIAFDPFLGNLHRVSAPSGVEDDGFPPNSGCTLLLLHCALTI